MSGYLRLALNMLSYIRLHFYSWLDLVRSDYVWLGRVVRLRLVISGYKRLSRVSSG